jgi:thioredoxin 1
MQRKPLNRVFNAMLAASWLAWAGCGEVSSGNRQAAASQHLVQLTRENFSKEVETSTIPVVVDFWAAWCGPCRQLAPLVAEMADEFHAGVKTGKVNVDEQPALAERFGIRAIPTLIVFQGGKKVDQMVGLPSKAALRQKYQALVAKP